MKKGQSLIELLIIIGLLAILLPSILTGWITSREGVPQQKQRLDASAYLKEAAEAIRSIRDNAGWNTLPAASSTMYYHVRSGNTWTLTAVPDQSETRGYLNATNSFYEKIIISSVNRDSTGAIVSSGGTTDPSTKKFDITITWTQPHNSNAVSTFYLTRQEDIPLVETTQNDFTQSGTTLDNVAASSPSNNPNSTDGELTLSTGGGGDWCSPGIPKFKLDLNGAAYAGAVVAGPDRAYVGMGESANGKAFYNIEVNTTGTDPTATCINPTCLYDPNPAIKTNDIYGESLIDKRYAYLATDRNDKEVIILDVTTASPNLKLNINLPGNINAYSVFVENNYLYAAGSDKKIYVYLLSSDRLTAEYKGVSDAMPAIGKNIFVANGIVFSALDLISKQFQIIDASNPVSPTLKGSLAINNANSQKGIDITAKSDGSRAYLVTSLSTTSDVAEFFIINTDQINAYANPSVIRSFDTKSHGDMNPFAVTLVSGNKAIIVGHGGEEYQVFKNLETDNLNFCGSTDVANLDINGVSSIIGNNGKTYSYIVTSDASNEFQIIEGGSGGLYASSGTYISTTYSYDQTRSFNRFIATVNQPLLTATVQLQVGVATGNVTPPYCDGITFTYLGPDASSPSGYSTSGSYKSTSTGISIINGIIPYGNVISTYNNPGRCFSYKALLNTSDSTQTPFFYDMTVNYSP